jgi:hypothetical protein
VDADKLGSAVDLAVAAFQRVGAVDLRPVVFPEAHAGEHVRLGRVRAPELGLEVEMSARLLGSKERGQLELFVTGSLRQLMPDDHILARVDRVLDRSWLPE